MLATIQALDEAKVQTPGTITFVADVGEEGLGDLRGMKNLFYESMAGQIDKFISVDGNGLGIVNIGVGSMRYRVTFKGPGGHSYGAFGMANAIQAMGRAIAKISDFKVPANPKTTFNVGRVGGGTSVNSIPSEAWMEVDMRSADVSSLKTLDQEFLARRPGRGGRGKPALEQPRQGQRLARTGRASSRRARLRKGRPLSSRLWLFLARWESWKGLREGVHRRQRSHEHEYPGHHHRRRRLRIGSSHPERNFRHYRFLAGDPTRGAVGNCTGQVTLAAPIFAIHPVL